jgi:hypothetical protein
MKNRAAQFVVTVVVGVAANITMASLPGATARAEECLAGPKWPAPQGSHWYYRVDRASKRNCWYVREVGQKAAQSSPTASPVPTASAKSPAVTPLQPSVANARAEYAPRQDDRMLTTVEPVTTATPSSDVFAGTQPSDPQVAGTQRWSLAGQGDAADTTTNDPSRAEVTADQQTIAGNPTALATKSSAPVQSAVSSIWMLLGALAAALAVAGALVGATMKFGSGSRPTVRRDSNGRPDIWGAAITEAKPSEDQPFAFEPERSVQPMNWIRIARERHITQDSSDEIEQLLARAPRRPA